MPSGRHRALTTWGNTGQRTLIMNLTANHWRTSPDLCPRPRLRPHLCIHPCPRFGRGARFGLRLRRVPACQRRLPATFRLRNYCLYRTVYICMTGEQRGHQKNGHAPKLVNIVTTANDYSKERGGTLIQYTYISSKLVLELRVVTTSL